MLDAQKHFEPVVPEDAGIDPAGILAFLDACEKKGRDLHSIVLIRDGKAAAEGYFSPYQRGDKSHVFSISKSWTATAVGLAVDEGRLSVRDKVISFFPEKCPTDISENLAAMEVRDLLRMGAGQREDLILHPGNTVPDWEYFFLHQPVEDVPGTRFLYNSGASYMLSAIVQKLTGEDLITYLTPRLFEPLGIKGVRWDRSPQGICCGGWGIHVSPEDIAKLGVLYLNGGVFEGKRILSEDWVKEATSIQIDNAPANSVPDWQQGYCYQIWRCQHNCFRFDGAYGQYMVAFPEKNAVLVLTSFVGNMQEVLDDVWTYILPAMKDAPLPHSPAGKELSERLARLSCPIPQGNGRSVNAEFVCQGNELGLKTIGVDATEDGGTLSAVCGEDCIRIPFGTASYKTADIKGFPIFPDMIGNNGQGSAATDCPIGATGNWTENVLNLRIVYRDTPHAMTLHLDLGTQPQLRFAYPCANFQGKDGAAQILLTPLKNL